MGALGQLEILDRDGQARQSFTVTHWPVQIGRALTNDLVLSDPHVAAEHFSIALTEQGLLLTVADTRNGVVLGHKRMHSGDSARLATDSEPIELTAGRTRLRLRLPDNALAPELPLVPVASLARRAGPGMLAGFALLAGLLFKTYLDTDPDDFARTAGSMLLATLVGSAVWCGTWALLSKTFTRQTHFGWHVRVLLFASLALLIVSSLPALIAFALSWPWLTDFAFIGEIAVAAAGLYFHLLAVEPARQRVLRWVAVSCAVVGVALSLWFNLQRTDQFGEELYMTHLFPPALRLAKPVTTNAFVEGLAPLKAVLDNKAREPGRGDDAGRGEDD